MAISISDIIEGCRRGDRCSQLAFYRQLAPGLYAACLRITADSAEAEEAMHDAMLKAFAALADGMEAPRVPQAWVRSIAVRVAIDRVRSRRVSFVSLDDVAQTGDMADRADYDGGDHDEAAVGLSVDAIRRAVAGLPDGYRVVLSLHLFEGYDFDEIASILNVKPVSVRSQFLRGRRRLIQMLKQ